MDSLIVGIGLPVTILVVLAAAGCVVSMAFGFGLKYPKGKRYTLGEEWDHRPLLFTATEMDPVALPAHAEPDDVEGGCASAKW